MTFIRSAGRAVSTTLVIAAFALGAVVLLPGIVGLHRYVITTGSMTGTYDPGSVVFDRTVPVDTLKVGDVITYTPPKGAGPTGLVTHRIVKIAYDRRGHEIFRTKGDANSIADPWTFRLSHSDQAKVAFSIPYIGYVYSTLATGRLLRWLLIAVPALLVALSAVVSLWREAGQEMAREEATTA